MYIRAYVYVAMCKHVHTRAWLCTYVHTCTWLCAHTVMSVVMSTCALSSGFVCMSVCMVMSVMPVRSKPRLCTYTCSKTCKTCVVMSTCGYVHVWLCPRVQTYSCMCVVMSVCAWLCPMCGYVCPRVRVLTRAWLCVVMSTVMVMSTCKHIMYVCVVMSVCVRGHARTL